MYDEHMTMHLAAITTIADDGFWTKLWFRDSASTFAPGTDAVYNFIFWTCAIAFLIVMGAALVFFVKYTGGRGTKPKVSPAHNTKVEIIWSVIPAIGFALMFAFGVVAYFPKLVPPADAEIIYVTANKWNWKLSYAEGVTPLESQRVADKPAPILAFPIDRPVQLQMTSEDVIHSFFLPEFRIKRDVFPNRYTNVWFQAEGPPTHTVDDDGKLVAIDAVGNPLPTDIIQDVAHPLYGTSQASRHGYYLFCAEYCGDQHSQMGNRVVTLAEADYQKWLDAQRDTSGIPLVELGAQLYKAQGCASCHLIESRIPGKQYANPPWGGIWGDTDHEMADGSTVTVDLNYIRESILEPNAKIVAGYGAAMPSYQGKLTSRELLALAMYIKSLSDDDAVAQEALQQSQDIAASVEDNPEDQQAIEAELEDTLNE